MNLHATDGHNPVSQGPESRPGCARPNWHRFRALCRTQSEPTHSKSKGFGENAVELKLTAANFENCSRYKSKELKETILLKVGPNPS